MNDSAQQHIGRAVLSSKMQPLSSPQISAPRSPLAESIKKLPVYSIPPIKPVSQKKISEGAGKSGE